MRATETQTIFTAGTTPEQVADAMRAMAEQVKERREVEERERVGSMCSRIAASLREKWGIDVGQTIRYYGKVGNDESILIQQRFIGDIDLIGVYDAWGAKVAAYCPACKKWLDAILAHKEYGMTSLVEFAESHTCQQPTEATVATPADKLYEAISEIVYDAVQYHNGG